MMKTYYVSIRREMNFHEGGNDYSFRIVIDTNDSLFIDNIVGNGVKSGVSYDDNSKEFKIIENLLRDSLGLFCNLVNKADGELVQYNRCMMGTLLVLDVIYKMDNYEDK